MRSFPIFLRVDKECDVWEFFQEFGDRQVAFDVHGLCAARQHGDRGCAARDHRRCRPRRELS